ncbi:hypothetical protein CHS0354_019123, partial [Potamilus streckersoni]
EVKVYHSTDEGETAALLACPALKYLYLKAGAPIFLNVFLSDELVKDSDELLLRFIRTVLKFHITFLQSINPRKETLLPVGNN